MCAFLVVLLCELMALCQAQVLQPGQVRTVDRQPFSSDSVWNTGIGSGAVFQDADEPMTRNLIDGSPSATINAAFYSVAVNIASPTDPIGTVSTPAGDFHHRIPTTTSIAAGTDGHMVVLDGRWAFEYWRAERRSETQYTASYGGRVDLLGPGVGGGTRASGFSVLGGLIRCQEIRDEHIPHALVMALTTEQLRTGWVWPAESEDSGGASTYRGLIPMGSMVGIPPSVDLGSLGLSADGLALAKALQDYGAYVGERSAQDVLYAEPECEGAALDRMRSDFRSTIRPLLRIITNSSADTVAGGGTRRVNAPPPVVPG
ncbi:hypothetical protein GCM10027261_18960 [Geodermatophilus arenarius]|uniref:Uncharacterized protein n=1 Tax=Geodermatophilus arenarius TaxID=1137990 RepID=A0ABV9LHZ1_9ACTN